jgi:hypothetical protein
MRSRPPVPVACTMDGALPAGRQIPLMTRSQATPESDRQAGLSTIVTETGAKDIFTVNSNSNPEERYSRVKRKIRVWNSGFVPMSLHE